MRKRGAGRIYLITNTVNDKGYVGQTHYPLTERWSGHVKEAYLPHNWNRTICRAIRKYGKEAFSIEDLEAGFDCQDGLNAAEKWWIAKLQTQQDTFGYNITDGGHKGWHLTEEARAQLSIIHKGLWQDPIYRANALEGQKKRWARPGEMARLAKINLGRKHTQEARERMRQRQLGVKHTEASKSKIAASNRRRKYSQATKEKLRAAALRQWDDPVMKEKWLAARPGHAATATTRARMSASQLGRKATDATRAKLRAAKLGGKKTSEQKAHMRVAQILRRAYDAPSKVPARNLNLDGLPAVSHDLFLKPELAREQSVVERTTAILSILEGNHTKALQWLVRTYGTQAVHEVVIADHQNAHRLTEAIALPWLHVLTFNSQKTQSIISDT